MLRSLARLATRAATAPPAAGLAARAAAAPPAAGSAARSAAAASAAAGPAPPPRRALPGALAHPALRRLPVIAAPLFIVSVPRLVIAQCVAGVVGSIPALNARPAAQLDEWLHEITEALAAHDRAHPERPAAPFALNAIVHKSNLRYEHDLAAAVKWRVPITITSLGARAELNEAMHAVGSVVLHDVTNDAHARKAVEKGADGLVAVCAGAGGHAGDKSPFALVAEIRRWFGGPVALAGAIATGRAVLAAQALGADFAYVGSAFVATHEARASGAYKQAIVDGTSDDIVGTPFFTGVFGNYMKSSIFAAGLDPLKLPAADKSKMDFSAAADKPVNGAAAADGAAAAGDAKPADGGTKPAAKPWLDVWGCGQGIAPIERVVTAGELVARLQTEYDAARAELLGGVARAGVAGAAPRRGGGGDDSRED